jgi:hypothetical protein
MKQIHLIGADAKNFRVGTEKPLEEIEPDSFNLDLQVVKYLILLIRRREIDAFLVRSDRFRLSRAYCHKNNIPLIEIPYAHPDNICQEINSYFDRFGIGLAVYLGTKQYLSELEKRLKEDGFKTESGVI